MTRRTNIPAVLFLLLAMTFAVAGCKKNKKEESPFTQFELSLTEKDTTQVAHLVNMFFEYLEHGQITDAVAMLYEDCDSNRYGKPDLLGNEKIVSVTNLLKSFPIVGHHIDYIKFRETYRNEVKATAIIAEAIDNQPEIKTVFYFKPVDYLGEWRLCLVNSDEGDRRIIKNAQADSMTNKFASQLEEKAKARSEGQ